MYQALFRDLFCGVYSQVGGDFRLAYQAIPEGVPDSPARSRSVSRRYVPMENLHAFYKTP